MLFVFEPIPRAAGMPAETVKKNTTPAFGVLLGLWE